MVFSHVMSRTVAPSHSNAEHLEGDRVPNEIVEPPRAGRHEGHVEAARGRHQIPQLGP